MRNGLDYSEHFKAEETLQVDAEGAMSCFVIFSQGQIYVLFSSIGVHFRFGSGFSPDLVLWTMSIFHLAHPNYSLQECQCGGRIWQPAKKEPSEGCARI